AAASSAICGLGETAYKQLGKDGLEAVVLWGEDGYVVARRAGECVVVAVANRHVKLGLLLLWVKKLAERIANELP
ncbi:MAG: hypothetical protein DRJ56_06050, partial [Thermoprotei archaeon]